MIEIAYFSQFILLLTVSGVLFALFSFVPTVRQNIDRWSLYIMGITPFVIITILSPKIISLALYEKQNFIVNYSIADILVFFFPLFLLFLLSLYWLFIENKSGKAFRNIMVSGGIIFVGQLYTIAAFYLAAIGNI